MLADIENDDLTLIKWKRKRKLTTILAMFHVCIYGLEYSSITISALYYFKDTLHVQNPTMFYSLAIGAMFSSAAISSTILGKYMDINRNARLIVIGTVLLAVIGNFMYCMPYSPWLPVVGRLLCGFSDATMPVMTGEFTRCYKKSEFNTVVYLYQIIYFTSFTIGPCTPLLFKDVDVHWFIQIDQNVCIGLFFMIVQIIFVIFSYFCLYNLPTEPGYELFLQTEYNGEELNSNDEDAISIDSNESNIYPTKTLSTTLYHPIKERKDFLTFKDVFKGVDLVLVIFGSSLSSLSTCILELQMNIFSVNVLKWSLNQLSGVSFVAIGLSVVLITITHKQVLKHSWTIYSFYVTCFVLSVVVMCTFMLVDATTVQSMSLEILVVCMIYLWNLFCTFGAMAFGRYLLFTLVPSNSSSYCEGIRNSFSRGSCGLAYFLAAPTFEYLFELYTVLNVINIVLCCMLYARRHSFAKVIKIYTRRE